MLRRWVRYARIVGLRDAVSRGYCGDPGCDWLGFYWDWPKHRRVVHGDVA